MRLLPIAFGCTILVLLTTSGMAQQYPEPVPAGPAAAPIPGSTPGLTALDSRPGIEHWTVDTSSAVPSRPDVRTSYGGEPSYIDPSCQGLENRTSCNASIEWIGLKLDRPASQPLVQDGSVAPPATVITTGALDFPLSSGLKTTLAYETDPTEGTAIELTYFGIYQWSSGLTVNGPADLQLPGNFGASVGTLNGQAFNDFHGASSMALFYNARIDSVEVNLSSPFTTSSAEPTSQLKQPSPVSILAGVRFIKMLENFGITSRRDDGVTSTGVPIAGGVSNYDINSSSNLFGAQTGMRYHAVRDCWEFGATFKGGIYCGTLAQHTFQTNADNSVVERDSTPSFTQTSFVAEANVSLGYHWRKNTILTVGYNALWLDGVARAPDSLDFSYRVDSGSTLNIQSIAFMHGPSCGLEYRW